ncbi:MAG: hypothetical protein ACTSRB_14725 [Candidatus Helarchaeota archaeon]
MTKKFEFLANVKDLSQHCVPKKDKNECFVQFKLAGYRRLGVNFSGLVLRFGKDTWDKQELKDVLLPRGVYRITIEPIEKDLLSFLQEKKRDASTSKQDEATYYLLKENPDFLANVLKFLLYPYDWEISEDYNGKECVKCRLNKQKSYRHSITRMAIDELLKSDAFKEWGKWDLLSLSKYHDGIGKLMEQKDLEEEQRLEQEREVAFIGDVIKIFSYPLKSALIARFDEMQDGMDELQETIKKATKKKKRKRKKRS